MARQAAHPEVSLTQASRPMTFEEYSELLELSPREPLCSRLDEYAVYFSIAADEDEWYPSRHLLETIERVDQMAVQIGAQTFHQWLQNHPEEEGMVDIDSFYAYSDYLFEQTCGPIWDAHLAAGAPYGPELRHELFHKIRRFRIPRSRRTWRTGPDLEPPTYRDATAEDVADCCPICQ